MAKTERLGVEFGQVCVRSSNACSVKASESAAKFMRDETLRIRKLWLGKLLKRRSADGIIHNDHHHDAGAIGPLPIPPRVFDGP
jgi:hypothetical protein